MHSYKFVIRSDMEKYNPQEIEKKWQKYWNEHPELYAAKDESNQEKKYILDMFPYPSGDGLHVGHVESYTATDIISRYYRMNDKNVLHPQGWDAFGLPAENYAIKTKIHPSVTTQKAIKTFKGQMNKLGFSYDWSREVCSANPEYYKWTQWFFLLLYKNNLAYKKKAKVNWCEKCQTVLANEQAAGGVCDRCQSPVVQKDLEQWFFKITDFIEDKGETAGLISGLNKIDWPESTKAAQRNWIGKSEGSQFRMEINGTDEKIEVYTTRLDTVFGMTYAVVAPEHEIIEKLKDKIKNYSEVEKYVTAARKKTELERTELQKEKTGVKLNGVEIINPFNDKKIPLYVADYVLGGYGTGAVMAVPAHDERDFEFAKKNNLPIKIVIESSKSFVVTIKESLNNNFYNEVRKFASVIEGTNSWDGLMLIFTEEIDRVFDLAEDNFIGKLWYIHSEGKIKKILFHNNKENTRFNWETDEEHKKAYEFGLSKGVKEEQLDWKGCYASFTEDGVLINSEKYDGLTSEEAREKMTAWLSEKGIGGQKINYRLRDWLVSRQRYWGAPIPIVYCEKCGEVPVPEKDLPVVLPDDVDFLPTGESPLVKSKKFHRVRCPQCGAEARRESDTMDTFVCSSWYYLRYSDPKNSNEFASKKALKRWLPVDIYVGGAEHSVLHLLYSRFFTKVLHSLGFVDFDEPFLKLRHQGIILAEDSRKMSKSFGNVINPDDVVNEYGADALRCFEMFMGPLEATKPWNTKGIIGIVRFLEKVWKLQEKANNKQQPATSKMQTLVHKTIKKVTDDVNNFRFNTAISQLMILVNAMEKEKELPIADYRLLITVLSPFAPHIAEEIWSSFAKASENKEKFEGSVFLQKWPVADEKYLVDEEIEMVVQVNGKLRDRIFVAPDVTEDEAKETALENEKIKVFTEGKDIKKIIFVAGKLINIVIS